LRRNGLFKTTDPHPDEQLAMVKFISSFEVIIRRSFEERFTQIAITHSAWVLTNIGLTKRKKNLKTMDDYNNDEEEDEDENKVAQMIQSINTDMDSFKKMQEEENRAISHYEWQRGYYARGGDDVDQGEIDEMFDHMMFDNNVIASSSTIEPGSRKQKITKEVQFQSDSDKRVYGDDGIIVVVSNNVETSEETIEDQQVKFINSRQSIFNSNLREEITEGQQIEGGKDSQVEPGSSQKYLSGWKSADVIERSKIAEEGIYLEYSIEQALKISTSGGQSGSSRKKKSEKLRQIGYSDIDVVTLKAFISGTIKNLPENNVNMLIVNVLRTCPRFERYFGITSS